jgi:methyltransferase-like protein
MSTRFSRNPKVEMAPMKGETVLFNPANNKFCVLNPTAAFIWQTLDQPRTLPEIAEAIAGHFANVDLARAEREAGVALDQLGGIECVVHHP